MVSEGGGCSVGEDMTGEDIVEEWGGHGGGEDTVGDEWGDMVGWRIW